MNELKRIRIFHRKGKFNLILILHFSIINAKVKASEHITKKMGTQKVKLHLYQPKKC